MALDRAGIEAAARRFSANYSPRQTEHQVCQHSLRRSGVRLLRGGGQRRALAGAVVAEPLFPCGRVVRPLRHLDAPFRRLGGKEEELRCAGVRQRGTTALACDTSSWVSAKISHRRAVLSADAVTMRVPSGLNAALSQTSAWPLSGSPIGLPVAASHSRAVLS